MSEVLSRFYQDAKEMLEGLAEQHGLSIPEGHATIESGTMHWRLSIHEDHELEYWSNAWHGAVQRLCLGTLISPGDLVADPEGRTWTLLGLDPSSHELPVRLCDASGGHHMAPVSCVKNLQLLVRKENSEG